MFVFLSYSVSLTDFPSLFLSPCPKPFVFLCFCWSLLAAARLASCLSPTASFARIAFPFSENRETCLNPITEKFKSFHSVFTSFSSWCSHTYSIADPNLEKMQGGGEPAGNFFKRDRCNGKEEDNMLGYGINDSALLDCAISMGLYGEANVEKSY